MKILKNLTLWCAVGIVMVPSLGFASNVSTSLESEEKVKVDEAIMKLQTNLKTSGHSLIDKLSSDFKNLTNYEETGSGMIKLSVNQGKYMSMSGNLKYDNYLVQNAGFNGKVSANIQAGMKMVENYSSLQVRPDDDKTGGKTQSSDQSKVTELSLASFVEFITVDGQSYLKLKDLDYTFSDPQMKAYFDQIKSVFEKNEFIKLSDNVESQQVMKILESMSASNITKMFDDVLDKPLLEAYSKKGEAYLLVPTKHACDQYFANSNNLGFISGLYTPETCTDFAYKEMVKRFLEAGELSLTLGENNTFTYSINEDDVSFVAELVYDDTAIQKFSFKVTPDQEEYLGEKFEFVYLRGQSVKLEFYADKGSVQAQFDGVLDASNHFVSFVGTAKSGKDFQAQIALKNHKLSGFMGMFVRNYDYVTGKSKYTQAYGMKISGATDSNNIMSMLKIRALGLEIKTKKKLFVGSFNYQSGDYNLSFNAGDEEGNLKIQANGHIENGYFTMNGTFDFNAYMATYSGKYMLNIDERNNQVNADASLSVTDGDMEVLGFEMLQRGQRTYKEVKIEAPANALPMDDLDLEEIFSGQEELYIDQ